MRPRFLPLTWHADTHAASRPASGGPECTTSWTVGAAGCSPGLFSCKGRGICPPCNTRRMAEVAAHLTDRGLPWLPVRQWVLFHLLVLDGAFSEDGHGEIRFHEAFCLQPDRWHRVHSPILPDPVGPTLPSFSPHIRASQRPFLPSSLLAPNTPGRDSGSPAPRPPRSPPRGTRAPRTASSHGCLPPGTDAGCQGCPAAPGSAPRRSSPPPASATVARSGPPWPPCSLTHGRPVRYTCP